MNAQVKTEHNWHLLDSKDKILGKLAVEATVLLMGKNKAIYNKYSDNGDIVVIINAKEVKFSGNKLKNKKYISHSGCPGGLKEISAGNLLDSNPERVIR